MAKQSSFSKIDCLLPGRLRFTHPRSVCVVSIGRTTSRTTDKVKMGRGRGRGGGSRGGGGEGEGGGAPVKQRFNKGKFKSYGRGRNYVTSEEDMEQRSRFEDWKHRKKGGESDDDENESGSEEESDEEEEEEEKGGEKGAEGEEGEEKQGKVKFAPRVQVRDLPPMESSDEEDDSEEEGGGATRGGQPKVYKKKGVEGIIEVDNPNLQTKGVNPPRMKKIKDLKKDIGDHVAAPSAPEPSSRREREEQEKAKAKEEALRRYREGETEQARKDLERLALVRQRREEASKKREEENRMKDEEEARVKAAAEGVGQGADDDGIEKLDPREIKKMNGAKLKECLKERGLSTQGQKKDLMDRLIEHATGGKK